MELLLYLGLFLALLAVGFFAGGYMERRHFRMLDEREADLHGMLVTQVRTFPGGVDPDGLPPRALMAESVIATDYLKTFVSGIRKVFGGELGAYHSLLERARREALTKILEEARELGYDGVCNLRYVTADIGGAMNTQKTAVAVAILACATAYKRPAEA